jgi:hypothetical protein
VSQGLPARPDLRAHRALKVRRALRVRRAIRAIPAEMRSSRRPRKRNNCAEDDLLQDVARVRARLAAVQSALRPAEGEMRRLQRFVEIGGAANGTDRHAYVLRLSSLPRELVRPGDKIEPGEGKERSTVENFKAADELLESAGLKAAFKMTIQ